MKSKFDSQEWHPTSSVPPVCPSPRPRSSERITTAASIGWHGGDRRRRRRWNACHFPDRAGLATASRAHGGTRMAMVSATRSGRGSCPENYRHRERRNLAFAQLSAMPRTNAEISSGSSAEPSRFSDDFLGKHRRHLLMQMPAMVCAHQIRKRRRSHHAQTVAATSPAQMRRHAAERPTARMAMGRMLAKPHSERKGWRAISGRSPGGPPRQLRQSARVRRVHVRRRIHLRINFCPMGLPAKVMCSEAAQHIRHRRKHIAQQRFPCSRP